MIKHTERYEKMINGERDAFSIKEILSEFMIGQKAANELIFNKIMESRSITDSNEASLKYIKWTLGMIIGAIGFLFVMLI